MFFAMAFAIVGRLWCAASSRARFGRDWMRGAHDRRDRHDRHDRRTTEAGGMSAGLRLLQDFCVCFQVLCPV
ncbi:hypothetical protein FsymDg_0622 [Candidatus Protofrankia datiscae]|uniref:Uncharacterized protein n=1 Tax=Candidatus Protofrankia datiscae TaxID=2716812 RepID=F8AUV3_9ACTN|nr:hypothetical protein FsymDg_0622 [Candidatus Protofrankia datiscae]